MEQFDSLFRTCSLVYLIIEYFESTLMYVIYKEYEIREIYEIADDVSSMIHPRAYLDLCALVYLTLPVTAAHSL